MSGPVTPILDAGTGHADLDPLISQWTSPTYTGQSEWIYYDNALSPNGGASSAYWDVSKYNPDSEVFYTVQNYHHIGDIRLVLRALGVGGAETGGSAYSYAARITEKGESTGSGGEYDIFISKNVAGTSSNILEGGPPVTLGVGSTLLFQAIGPNLYLWHRPAGGSWTVIATASDGSVTAPGFIGIYSDSTAARFLDFGGGSVFSGYPKEVMADNPLVYYRLDGTIGRTVDSSLNSRTLTEIGANFTNVNGLVADGDGATKFDNGFGTGVLNLADSTAVKFDATDPFTVEAWVSISVEPTTSYLSPYAWSDIASGGTNGYGLAYQSAAGWVGYRRSAGVDVSTNWLPPGGLKINRPYHVLWTYTPSLQTLWVDGVSVDTTVDANSQGAYAGTLYVGASQFGGSSGRATLDEFAIYAGVLADARIQKHYAVGNTFKINTPHQMIQVGR